MSQCGEPNKVRFERHFITKTLPNASRINSKRVLLDFRDSKTILKETSNCVTALWERQDRGGGRTLHGGS